MTTHGVNVKKITSRGMFPIKLKKVFGTEIVRKNTDNYIFSMFYLLRWNICKK